MIYFVLTVLSILCIIMFLVIMFLIVKVRESVVLIDAYQKESTNYMEKFDHLCSQLESHKFKVSLTYRSRCYIEVCPSNDKLG